MHITDLDVYRSPIHLNFNRILREHNTVPYSREWDDQIAVTIPAAFENPEKAWDMRQHGFNMSVMHNGRYDGKDMVGLGLGSNPNRTVYSFLDFWHKKKGRDYFNVGREMCEPYLIFGG